MDPSTLNPSQKKEKSYYDSAVQWIEDTYLSFFGENRTSYGTKESLKKTQITGNKDIDSIQESVGETVGNTFGSNGLAGAVGDSVDKGMLKGNV
ncbi:hypothetical protein BGZ60DRAFT_423524 [Tricladium varicosporioides]|nr:hypothetical protein BGZ60DRAFT_423524 [Hymenoscyphus varicosporioides]